MCIARLRAVDARHCDVALEASSLDECGRVLEIASLDRKVNFRGKFLRKFIDDGLHHVLEWQIGDGAHEIGRLFEVLQIAEHRPPDLGIQDLRQDAATGE